MTKKVIILLLLFTFCGNSQNVFAQEGSVQSNTSFFNKKNMSLVGLSGIYAVSIVHSYYMWWHNNSRQFHFFNEWGWLNEPGALGLDRVGHFYTSYFFYHTQKNLLEWGGHSKEFSRWFSAGLAAGFAVIIEVGDGFSTYGFDHKDLLFNLGGVGYGILQDYFPVLQNFKFKWSYVPPGGYKFPPKFTEHYDGHIYWLTIDIHNLFKDSFGKYFPKFVQPAIGFSLADNGSRREFVVGLDWNFNFLFENTNEDWNFLGKTLDLYHFPAPGIKYSPSRKPEYRLLLMN